MGKWVLSLISLSKDFLPIEIHAMKLPSWPLMCHDKEHATASTLSTVFDWLISVKREPPLTKANIPNKRVALGKS